MNDIRIPVLTLRQPWADIVTLGFCDVINRRFDTPHRGWLLISAASQIDHSAPSWATCCPGDRSMRALIGAVYVVDVALDHPSQCAEPYRWHWVLDSEKHVYFETRISHIGRPGLMLANHTITDRLDPTIWQAITSDGVDTSWHRDR